METIYDRVQAFIEEHRDEMLGMWEDFVNTPSPSRDRLSAMKMADKLMDIYAALGMKVRGYDVGPVNSRLIVADWNTKAPGAPVLLSGHYDTVDPSPVPDAQPGAENALDGTPHFRIDAEGRAHGLGCLDMQGGLVIAIWALRALQAVGWAERPIRFLFAGDEDKGHQLGNTPEQMMEHAKGCLCAFNLETGRVQNEICIGRKGGGQADLEVRGRAAHAGNEYAKGCNAVLEMAVKAQELAALTDLENGTTVSPTVVRGGTVPNGIPGQCSLTLDVRYNKQSERLRVEREFQRIAAEVHIPGTESTIRFKEYMAAFDITPQGEALADFVATVSERHGLGAMGKVFLGGGSDASYLTIAGVPTICSMGVCGQFNHTSDEYAIVETLYTRTKLLAFALIDLEGYPANG